MIHSYHKISILLQEVRRQTKYECESLEHQWEQEFCVNVHTPTVDPQASDSRASGRSETMEKLIHRPGATQSTCANILQKTAHEDASLRRIVLPPTQTAEELGICMTTSKKSCCKKNLNTSSRGRPTNEIRTCLDCSSVISSDAFIPFSVINLVWSVRMNEQTKMKKESRTKKPSCFVPPNPCSP